MDCEAGAGFGEGSAGAAANATVEVATTPASVAAAATADMSLRLEPFKVFPFTDDVGAAERGPAARETRCVWGCIRGSLGPEARAPPPTRRPRVWAVPGGRLRMHLTDTSDGQQAKDGMRRCGRQ
ncbi:hypothetical protein GCM10014713_00980 [Streptomyces purpureus]|uniref:Uncharacterized protein n=1 Tax=Streptomyces purpureus TaxID=1951 RepID=A0A918LLP7_9ACTN|nr:hypothetical protein GCM10014713_00980 [Streptomyces purpureus]